MTALAADLVVMAAATVLMSAGSAKLMSPQPIAATLSMLRSAVVLRAHSSPPTVLGRLLGAAEIGLAAGVVLARTWAASAALALFAFALAGAGAIGVLGKGDIPCACFGKSERTLGWVHIAQLPLWMAAAWGASRDPSLLSWATRTEQVLLMLAACAALAATAPVLKLMVNISALARSRRQRAADIAVAKAAGPGAFSW